MSSIRTCARGSGAGPDYPAHGHQLASKKHKEKSSLSPKCCLVSVALLTLMMACRLRTSAPRLNAGILSHLADQAKSQLDSWREEPQSHEQVAVGEYTLRAAEKVEEFFQDVEENVKGDTK